MYPKLDYPNSFRYDMENMSSQELRDYLDWFYSIKSDRICEMSKRIFGKSIPDYSKIELQSIFYFLQKELVTEEKSPDEIAIERESLPDKIKEHHKILSYRLVEPSQTIVFDVSIYFAEYIKHKVQGVKWQQELKKGMVDFGMPTLINANSMVRLNPFGVINVFVKKLLDRRANEDDLLKLMDFWIQRFYGKKTDYLNLIEKWSKGKE